MPGLPEGDGQPKGSPDAEPRVDFRVDDSIWEFIVGLPPSVKQVLGGLRVSVRGGGCSGLSYHFEWGPEKEGDIVIIEPGPDSYYRVYVDRRSMLFLKGSELVYEVTPFASVLKIRNPNAKATCGCGESFSV